MTARSASPSRSSFRAARGGVRQSHGGDARYEVLRRLGAGGMAAVHLARLSNDEGTRLVAIKHLHDFIGADPKNVAMLTEEARIGRFVQHPNVVRILGVTRDDQHPSPGVVMEYVAGLDLWTLQSRVLASGRRLPVDVAVAIASSVLDGLHAAHEAVDDDGALLEIVHRDISPQNILVGFDGVPRVADFGVAMSAWRAHTTEPGAIKGKLAYMAPEQLDGKCDRRADVYSTGIVLWELLTGLRLRTADGAGPQILVQILHGIVVPPSQHLPGVALLDDIVLKALAHRPDDRFATAREMARVLEHRVTPASSTRIAEVMASVAMDRRSSPGCTEPDYEETHTVPIPRLVASTSPAPTLPPADRHRLHAHARDRDGPFRLRHAWRRPSATCDSTYGSVSQSHLEECHAVRGACAECIDHRHPRRLRVGR